MLLVVIIRQASSPSSDKIIHTLAGMMSTSFRRDDNADDQTSSTSYASLNEHTGTMSAHVIVMLITWVFVLPVGMLPKRPSLLLMND
jgi:hypothetical protein